jgi:radical SAM protein with 4Fe4S-binding SPASM domain
MGGGCAAGALGGVIFNDGEVRPCEMLEHSFGNIRDHDYQLPALWNSSEARERRAWIQDTKCMCTQECFLSISLLIQPRHWADIVKERLKLLMYR